MPFDFPASPTTGQVFNAPTGQGYVFSGTAWNLAQSSPQAPVASDNPPANPYAGQLWLRSTTGALYCWYTDPTSSQWIQIPGNIAPVAPQAWELIGDSLFTGQTQLVIANLGAFKRLRLNGILQMTAQAYPLIVLSLDNGATFKTGATDYKYQQTTCTGATPTSAGGSITSMPLSSTTDSTGAATFHTNIEQFNTASGGVALCTIGDATTSGAITQVYQMARTTFVGPCNALRIGNNAGTTMTGSVLLEGVRG